MFEIGNFAPLWVFIIVIPIVIVLGITGIKFFNNQLNKVTSKLESFTYNALLLFSVMLVLMTIVFTLILSTVPVSTTSYDNPVSLTKEQADKFSHINNNKFEDKISKSIDADKVSFEEISDEKMFESFRNNEFVNFKALKGTNEISGNVYFTKNDMVILLKNESKENGKEIKVPMK